MPRRKTKGSHSLVQRPETITSPAVGVSMRLMSFRIVDLPAPLVPTSTTVSPRLTPNETFCRMVFDARVKDTSRNSIATSSEGTTAGLYRSGHAPCHRPARGEHG